MPKESDTLLFMGCLSSMKVPKYTLNAIKYMLSKGHHFTILDREVCCGIPLLDSGEKEIYDAITITDKGIYTGTIRVNKNNEEFIDDGLISKENIKKIMIFNKKGKSQNILF